MAPSSFATPCSAAARSCCRAHAVTADAPKIRQVVHLHSARAALSTACQVARLRDSAVPAHCRSAQCCTARMDVGTALTAEGAHADHSAPANSGTAPYAAAPHAPA